MNSLFYFFACLACATATGLLSIRDDGQWKPLLDNSLRGQWNPLIDNSLRGQWNPLLDGSLLGVGNAHALGGLGLVGGRAGLLGAHAGLLGGHLIGKRSIGAIGIGAVPVVATAGVIGAPAVIGAHGGVIGAPLIHTGIWGHGAILG